jgi:[CysO sulfur-carrier protein]-S-L-cysteine hydrolase
LVRLRLPSDQVQMLAAALQRAGAKEIGGQVFGEQLLPSDFRAIELTFQARPGTFARFVVDLMQVVRDAVRFFERTGHRYTRFNYIGEWHSHPNFEVRPSTTDRESMQRLVGDPDFRGSFAILMITRLDREGPNCGAWLFDPRGNESDVQLEFER